MLYEKLTNDVKDAMKSGNNVKRDCLRAIVSEIKNQTVNAGKEITDDVCLKTIKKSIKQHNDSIENFKSGNRFDLVEKEMLELTILNEYCPKMLSEDETKSLIDHIISSNNIEPIKRNMGVIMKQLTDNVDKKIASRYLLMTLK